MNCDSHFRPGRLIVPPVRAPRCWAYGPSPEHCHRIVYGLCAAAIVLLVRIAVSADQPVSDESVLVLTTGAVLQGPLEPVPGGYSIRQSQGSVIIPFTHVRLTAATVDEAAQKLREGLPNATAGDLLVLAQWCADQKLYDAARKHLHDALRLEPQRAEARALLLRVEELSNPAPAHLAAAPVRRPTADGYDRSPPRSTAGLSRELNQDFVRRVQPLLTNKCASAGCHGGATDNDLHLAGVRSGFGNQHAQTEHNLDAVMTFIDVRHPDASRLLQVPFNSADATHQDVFRGPQGSEQFQLLRQWVQRVAASLPQGQPQSLASAPSPPPSAPSSRVIPVSGERLDSGSQSRAVSSATAPRTLPVSPAARPIAPAGSMPIAAAPVAAAAPAPTPGAVRPTAREAAFLDEVLREERADPFDPEEFNRLMHGTASPATR